MTGETRRWLRDRFSVAGAKDDRRDTGQSRRFPFHAAGHSAGKEEA
jgi:hypothetical protein